MKHTFENIKSKTSLSPLKGCLSIRTIEMHTGGEPLRVILEGFPELKGTTVLERRKDCEKRFDNLRTALIHEPRGHADMYGCILLPPDRDDSNFGIIFLHNEGYSTMCGHAIIAITKLAALLKWVQIKNGLNEVKIDAPCGQITSYFNYSDGDIADVRFLCVPSFVLTLDSKVHIDGFGEVIYDLAYGGAFYAYVDMAKNDFKFDLTVASYADLREMGMMIKRAIIDSDVEIEHPFEDELSFLYGTIFIDNGKQASGSDSRNVCIFAEGEVDRCPTGSGIAGRMAIHNERGEMRVGAQKTIESISGSVFIGSIAEQLQYSEYSAVIAEVRGNAYVIGSNTFMIDPKDPIKYGFLLR